MSDIQDLQRSYVRNIIGQGPLRARSASVDMDGRPLPMRYLGHRLLGAVDEFLSGDRDQRLILIPGLRGTGKSTVLAQVYLGLQDRGVSTDRILCFSADESIGMVGAGIATVLRQFEQATMRELALLDKQHPEFILVDEAQYDPEWEVVIKSLYDSNRNIFMIVTGSSAMHLISNADLARRSDVVHLPPLSLREHLRIWSERNDDGPHKRCLPDLLNSRTADDAAAIMRDYLASNATVSLGVTDQVFDRYVRIGSLPSSRPFRDEDQAHRRNISVIDKIVFQDIPGAAAIRHESTMKLRMLLSILAVQDRVSQQTLSNNLGVSRPTLAEMMRHLERTELVHKVLPYGSVAAQVRQTPKMMFTAPCFRTALRYSMGQWDDSREAYGSLLEDAVASVLKRCRDEGSIQGYYFDAEDGGADFVVTCNDGSNVAVEVGMGSKDMGQVLRTMRRCSAKYGMVVSKGDLQVIDDKKILQVPRELFLLDA